MEERSKYAGQPVGLIVARDRDTAVRAARMVLVSYGDMKKPVVTIKDALAEGGRDELAINFITGKVEPAVLGDPEGTSLNYCNRKQHNANMYSEINFPHQSPGKPYPSHFIMHKVLDAISVLTTSVNLIAPVCTILQFFSFLDVEPSVISIYLYLANIPIKMDSHLGFRFSTL